MQGISGGTLPCQLALRGISQRVLVGLRGIPWGMPGEALAGQLGLQRLS